MSPFETNHLKYIVAAKMYSGLVQKIFDATGRVSYPDGIDMCYIDCKLSGWNHKRRIEVDRKDGEEVKKIGGFEVVRW